MTEQKQASIKKELERYQLSYRKDGEPIVVRRFGKKNVFFLNAEKEIDFMVPDEKLAIQVSYSINDQTTKDREVLEKPREFDPRGQATMTLASKKKH